MTAAPITSASIATAEVLFGVAYTEAERDLMLPSIAAQVQSALLRRATGLPNDLAPATRFDPRLPGFAMPTPAPMAWQPVSRTLPTSDDEIAFAPANALAGWIQHRQLTAERLTQLYLARIARHNPTLLCFATITAATALDRARALDAMAARGEWLGPLHGIPYGMKDIIDTAGVQTSWGAEPYQGRTPSTDAFITTALHEAGAVMLGKTTVGALAYGDIWHGGRTLNPWNLDEGSSGSSAGSGSATAAGLVGFAIGTETLGSIVAPSTRCGTAGLRPTFGRVSRRGAMPLCPSLDKIGAICRDVMDTALVLQAICGADPADPCQIPAPLGDGAGTDVARLRVGFHEADFADPACHALDHAALEAVRGLGCHVVALPRRDLPYGALTAILYAEAAASFEDLTLSGRDDELTWQDADAWPNAFRKARFLSAVDHIQLDRFRRLVMQEMDAAFGQVDAIIGPSQVGPMLVITNFTGHPCLCLPIGVRPSPPRGRPSLARARLDLDSPASGPVRDVPHTVCLWGRLFDEGTVLALGRALETHFADSSRRPML